VCTVAVKVHDVARIQRKNLNSPDERRPFPHGLGEFTAVGNVSIGRGRLEPGWRWSVDIKPLAGTAFCEIHHVQILLAGRMHVQMDDGESADIETWDLVDIPPGHDTWVIGDEAVITLDLSGNVAGFALPSTNDRVLATMLMTDIVDSTATAARLGDAAWKQVLGAHNRAVRQELERHRGHEVNTTGDGFLATFGSAVGAIRCAMAIRDATERLGIAIRAGVHTGEVELLPNDIGGVAVHVLARITALAGPREILVSAATRGLVEGSGLRFEDHGAHPVKGIETAVEVFRLAS
jgi:class 3 adenylate cyclase